MQKYRCENCGSTELVVKNGYKVCPYCETRYAAISTTTISLKSDIEMLLEKGKGHNPNYTADAVGYLGEYVSAKTKLMKKSPTEEEKAAFVRSWDWNRMTAQDDMVWKKIFACLDA